jgi:hypothetical protein
MENFKIIYQQDYDHILLSQNKALVKICGPSKNIKALALRNEDVMTKV